MKGKKMSMLQMANCIYYNQNENQCKVLTSMSCGEKCSCTFFLDAKGAELGRRKHKELMRAKPKQTQRFQADVYYNGKMIWQDKIAENGLANAICNIES